RIPACCCGVFGFKPSHGRVSREGVMPSHSSLDCVGPLAASLPMLIRAMGMIDPSFSAAPLPDTARVGVVAVSAEPAVQRVIDSALQASGLSLSAVELAHFTEAYAAGMVVINRETFDACSPLLASGKVGADIAGRLEAAGTTSAQALAEAEAVRQRFTAAVDQALTRVDVLALPTMPDFPLRLEEAADTRAVLGMTALVRPFNLSGHPALSMPLGSREGLPVGLQLIAAKGADAQLLAVAERLLLNLCSTPLQAGGAA
ncbi:amidase, partial [Pseudomonas sp.]|uniref:amidase n=1 Tax=Pseudomonas sp. TaxID=306 RepID=UPI0028A5D006